jgi:hypothetical protein
VTTDIVTEDHWCGWELRRVRVGERDNIWRLFYEPLTLTDEPQREVPLHKLVNEVDAFNLIEEIIADGATNKCILGLVLCFRDVRRRRDSKHTPFIPRTAA